MYVCCRHPSRRPCIYLALMFNQELICDGHHWMVGLFHDNSLCKNLELRARAIEEQVAAITVQIAIL